jgi:hypothetical protein
MLLGSKENKYRYMVERLGVTGNAGGVDVLVLFTFTILAIILTHPHPFFPFLSFPTGQCSSSSHPSSHSSGAPD